MERRPQRTLLQQMSLLAEDGWDMALELAVDDIRSCSRSSSGRPRWLAVRDYGCHSWGRHPCDNRGLD